MAVRCSSTIGIAIVAHRTSVNRRHGRTIAANTRSDSPIGGLTPWSGASSYFIDELPPGSGQTKIFTTTASLLEEPTVAMMDSSNPLGAIDVHFVLLAESGRPLHPSTAAACV